MVESVYVHRFEIAFAVTMDKTFLHNPHSANCEKRRTNEWTGQGELQKNPKYCAVEKSIDSLLPKINIV